MRRGLEPSCRRAGAAFVLVLVLLLGRRAHADPLVEALATDDPHALSRAVDAVEAAPTDADALYAAGRACEDTLLDPARAARLYDRIAHEAPDARVAIAASRRRSSLAAELGPGAAHAAEAAELAQLVAGADTLGHDDIVRRGDALAATSWPGAKRTALWLASWLRRAGRCDEATPRYLALANARDASEIALHALRGAAGCALDVHDWARAEELARDLPTTTPADSLIRDDLLAKAARGRARERLYTAAWIVLALSVVALAGSLASTRRRPRLRPPDEVIFVAPIAAVLVLVALTANPLIAPAVAIVSAGGLGIAWLSAAGLDAAQANGRPIRIRALLHVVACIAGVLALGYLAITRDGLLDALLETVRFGPEL